MQIVSLGLLSCGDLNFVVKRFMSYFNLFQSGKMGGSAHAPSIYGTLLMGVGVGKEELTLPQLSQESIEQ